MPARSACPGSPASSATGILPGLYGYEAGQVAVGDMLAWYVDTFAGDYGALESGAAELGARVDRTARARLVEREPLDPRRRRSDAA